MSKQPEALRLADCLAWIVIVDEVGGNNPLAKHAAAELRRLHRLNAELLQALNGLVGWFDDDSRDGADKHIKMARSAIAKATGTTP